MIFGIILLLIGISIMLPKIPIFNILFGAGLILLGVSIFLEKDFKSLIGFSSPNVIVFNEGIFTYDENQKEYVTVFGNTQLDLTSAKFNDKKNLEIISVFGNSQVTLNKNSNFKIKSTTVFGSTNFPNDKNEGFGDLTIKSENFDENRPHLDIEVISVFGNTDITYKGGMNNAF